MRVDTAQSYIRLEVTWVLKSDALDRLAGIEGVVGEGVKNDRLRQLRYET